LEEANAALAAPNERAEFALRSLRAARLRHYSVVIVVVRNPAKKRRENNKQTNSRCPFAKPQKKREAQK
jgi:hypothetical protein